MLPFTREKLKIAGQSIFYYDKNSYVLSINTFSQQIFQDLKQYLGIQEEINKRKKMALAINSEYDYVNSQPIIVQKLYDKNKIQRIELMYDSYVDFVLKFMQILYYEKFEDQYVYKYDENVFTAIEQTVDALVDDNNYNFAEFQENLVQALNVDQNHMKEVEQKFLKTFRRFVKGSGVQLSDCYKEAIQKLQPLRNIIEEQIKDEFPIKTYQDKVVEEQHLVVAKKKKTKK
ncbi:hypothetical protein ABPG74_005755 [Tetrahymena malaccensis]